MPDAGKLDVEEVGYHKKSDTIRAKKVRRQSISTMAERGPATANDEGKGHEPVEGRPLDCPDRKG